MSLVRGQLQSKGLSQEATDTILSSWRTGTKKQYQTYLDKWTKYCDSRGLNPISTTVTQGINFLAELMSHNIGYSGINTARSALSSVLTVHDCSTFGTHPLVKRFMKGVFENRPSLPRYTCPWYVSTVLKFLSSLPNLEEITLKDLSRKVVMLMALLTGQRAQTLHALDISSMEMTENKITFYITEVLKHIKPGRHQQPIEFVAFEQDPTLCIVSHIKGYLRRTSSHRNDQSRLLLSYVNPFNPISKDTLSRWVKETLSQAGIDTKTFSAHSTRAASTSTAEAKGVPIQCITDSAGWSNCHTFAKFYKKPQQVVKNYGSELLQAITS